MAELALPAEVCADSFGCGGGMAEGEPTSMMDAPHLAQNLLPAELA